MYERLHCVALNRIGHPMLAVSRRRLRAVGYSFRSLLFSDALMLLALMVGQVVTPWWIAHAGGASHLAIYAVIAASSSVLAMLLLSPLGDRLPKGALIRYSLAALALQSLLLALMATLGWYRLGPVLGGVMLASAGTAAALWLHCVLLCCAAVLARRIPARLDVAKPAAAGRWLTELRLGMAAKWHIPIERGWTMVNFLVSICFMPTVGMLLPLKLQSLGLSGGWLGICEASLSAGMLFGSAWLANRASARLGRVRAMFASLLAAGVGIVLVGRVARPYWLAVLFGLMGNCLAVTQLVGQTHRLLVIPDTFRARISAVNIMTAQVAGSLGPALDGLLVAHLSVGQVYELMGAGFFAQYAGATCRPRFNDLSGARSSSRAGLVCPAALRGFRCRALIGRVLRATFLTMLPPFFRYGPS
jgi:hypothetical protein